MLDRTISHYKIIDKLGEGGMGVVYKAEDLRLERTVALKFLPHHMCQNEEEKSRFINEAKTASAIEHRNVNTVYDIDETEDGQLFIVMSFVEGETLKEKIETGPLKIETAVNYLIQTAEGLKRAHEKGIIHRDIKPANLMITKEGEIKILDFGLAKLPGKTKLTKLGTTLGTINYMSPEQARGEEVDYRTDIWSLGIIGYEMITGRPPFKGEYEQSIIYSVMNEAAEPPTGLRTGVPMELERIINKTMSKEPRDRYQSLDDLIVDLKHIMSQSASDQTTKGKLNLWKRKKNAFLISVVAITIIFLFLLIISLLPDEKINEIRSIAVLPLDNLSHNPDQEYIVDGMTEALITELSKINALKVISRTSVMQYKDKKEHIHDIARELNVDAIVEGSALMINDKIRITAQLINASSDQHIWAKEFDREFADVLSLHKEVAREIASEIKIKLSVEEEKSLAGTNKVNPEVLDLVLKGRYLFKTDSRLESRLKSIEYYEEAIKIDSSYALAYAYLANAVRYLMYYGYKPSELSERVNKAALKSLELDPNLAFAHMQYGMYKFYLEWDWSAVEYELKKALELEPNNSDVFAGLASYYGYTGQYDKGLEANRRAVQLSPAENGLKNQKVWLLYHSRRYDAGMKYVNSVLEIDPRAIDREYWLTLFYLLKKDCYNTILECDKFEEKTNKHPTPEKWAIISYANGFCGNEEKAKLYLEKLLSFKEWYDPGMLVLVYIGLDDMNEALKWVKKTIEDRAPYCFFIKRAPAFDPLRGIPRFQELMKQSNLP